MGVFRYFLPGLERSQVDLPAVTARGLADRLGDLFAPSRQAQAAAGIGGVQVSGVRHGPGGLDGALIVPLPVDGTAPAHAEYAADGQTWIESRRGTYWIGRDDAEPPDAAGLLRRDLVAGYEQTLGDGGVWTCPIIRRAVIEACVPCRYERMGESITRQPLPQYQEIFAQALAWAGKYLGGDGLPLNEQWDAAVACLAVNYRVGDEEVSLLGLCDDRTMRLVIESAIDLPWLREAISGADPQKAAVWREISSELESIARGREDSSPATAPPSPTSSCAGSGGENPVRDPRAVPA